MKRSQVEWSEEKEREGIGEAAYINFEWMEGMNHVSGEA
jgi:hypothetical protein